MTPKIENVGLNFAHFDRFERLFFAHFGGRKSHILDFSKVVLDLFRKCLGIVFGIKRTTFDCIFNTKLYPLLPIADPLLWGPANGEALINVDKASSGFFISLELCIVILQSN